jgi:N-acetylglutamate synthase-like GNAT family acetyltransferase
VKELQPGIYLRRAQEKDSRAIAALVKQLGRTLQSNDRRSVWPLLLWVGVGFWGVLALSYWGTAVALLKALLGAIVPLGVFLGLVGTIAWLNPLITWSDYWVIENHGSLVACAKLYEGNTTCELYDVFVVPHWRGYGFGTLLVKTLSQEARYSLYLACLPNAIGFYERLGFTTTIEALDPGLMRRLSLKNPHYQKLGLTPMVQKPQKR